MRGRKFIYSIVILFTVLSCRHNVERSFEFEETIPNSGGVKISADFSNFARDGTICLITKRNIVIHSRGWHVHRAGKDFLEVAKRGLPGTPTKSTYLILEDNSLYELDEDIVRRELPENSAISIWNQFTEDGTLNAPKHDLLLTLEPSEGSEVKTYSTLKLAKESHSRR